MELYARQSWASVMTGAFFCLLLGLGLVSCDADDSGSPDWGKAGEAADSRVEASRGEARQASKSEPRSKSSPTVGAEGGLRFMTYNVENWLTMERRVGDRNQVAGKPEREKAAVVALVARHRPDVLGVIEIGDAGDIADLQKRLRDAGWEMRFRQHGDLAESPRNVVILSRLPMVRRDEPAVKEYELQGRRWRMQRPILDVTIDHGGVDYRFIGVHLKSKREVADGDQEQIRLQEARLLRRHLDAVFKSDAGARIVLYGDFNDTRNSAPMKVVVGSYRSPDYITLIPARDSRGDSWTHYWDNQDVYSRFDYVGVSAALKPETDFKGSFIIDDREWDEGSDHRPVMALFRSRAATPR